VVAGLVIWSATLLSAGVAGGPLRPPPSTAGTDLLGRRVSLGSLRGVPVVVTFFASWCGPCHEDAPVFTHLVDRYADRVRLISVDVGDPPRDARAFAARYGWTWPVVPDDAHRWVTAFGPPGVPATFVLDAGGAVTETFPGAVTEGQIVAALERVLRPG
jgi:cytochrome c biogenesis protein CcmG/thiol:disulfide interchange protein DsbE